MIKKILLTSFILICAIGFSKAQVQPLLLESFSGYNILDTLDHQSSWSMCSAGTDHLVINQNNYEYPDTAFNPHYDPDPAPNSQNTANCIYFDSTFSNLGGYCNGFSPVANGRVYLAFIYQGGTEHRVNTTGDYFITIGASNSSHAARVLVKYIAGSIVFGVRKENGTDVWGTQSYTDAHNHLLVLAYEFKPGVNDDQVMLFVDPVIPGPPPMTPDVMGNTADPDFVGSISNLFIRLNIPTANMPSAYIDNIMVDTSWQNISPAPCMASFTETTSALTATFANTSTGGFHSYLYDYGVTPPNYSSVPSYTYTVAGTYKVCLSLYTDANANANNFCDSTCHNVTVIAGGINNMANTFDASIIYNQNEKPSLKIVSTNNYTATINLLNALGQTVETVFSGNIVAGEKIFTTSMHQSGMYFYQIISDKGNKTLKAFVK
ncbi:MAG: hypothetical protein RJA07_19 [Bacteroidota bacterium]|jgi:hypothetical protein